MSLRQERFKLPKEKVSMRASERAYCVLRQDIIEWRLLPGTALSEVEQAERLGVSRTPLRLALARLTSEGLTTAGGRGVMVTVMSLAAIDELFELRQILEVQATALAAERGEPGVFRALVMELRSSFPVTGDAPTAKEYHELADQLDAAIDGAIANSYLAQAMQSLRIHSMRLRPLFPQDHLQRAAAAAELAAVADAIVAGNPPLAAASATLHLHRIHSFIRTTYRSLDKEHHG